MRTPGYTLAGIPRHVHFTHDSHEDMIKIDKVVTMVPQDLFIICVTGTRFQSLPQVSLGFLVISLFHQNCNYV